MKYIEKVILENFQSHKNSVITFDNQLNVIVGPSDSGKTAILRGIKWALYNEPSGDHFIKEGESYCSVTIIFNDSTKIKRYRSKSKNSYYLYDSDNNETKFEGFGTTVPQEVIDKTGVKKILLDNDHASAINLSDQLEGAFLLSERGSIRASSIGRLVGVNVIDDSLRETLKDIRSLSGDKRHIDANILELEEELIEYEYLEEFQNKIDNLEVIRNRIYEKEQSLIKYNNIYSKLLNLLKDKKLIEDYMEKLENIDILDDIIRKVSLSLSKYKYLDNQKQKLSTVYKDKEYSRSIAYSLKSLELVEDKLEDILLKSRSEIKISKLKMSFDNNSIEIQRLNEALSKLNNLDKIQILINDISRSVKLLDGTKSKGKKVSDLQRSLSIGKDYLKKLEYTEEIEKIYSDINKKIILFNQLKLILVKYMGNKKEMDETNNYVIRIKKTFEKDLERYKKLLLNQETCPLCFSSIDNNKIEHIISHYN